MPVACEQLAAAAGQCWDCNSCWGIKVPVCVVTLQVAMHTEYYTRPRLQRHVIRILWMVPIYSLDAWFALRFNHARAYLDPIREIYEAYVIYNFYAYLMNYLEDELGLVDEHLAKKAQVGHVWPCNYFLKPWRMGQEFIWETKKVSLQQPKSSIATASVAVSSIKYSSSGNAALACLVAPATSASRLAYRMWMYVASQGEYLPCILPILVLPFMSCLLLHVIVRV